MSGQGTLKISEAEGLAYFESLSNWGRWGDDDERGTLNLGGHAEVAAALAPPHNPARHGIPAQDAGQGRGRGQDRDGRGDRLVRAWLPRLRSHSHRQPGPHVLEPADVQRA